MLDDAVFEWQSWVGKGRPMDKNDKVKLSQAAAKTIVKALMPCVDPTKKVKDYTAKYKCVEWLHGLNSWEAEMDVLGKEAGRKTKEMHTPMFSIAPKT